jgi:hypothetical protein
MAWLEKIFDAFDLNAWLAVLGSVSTLLGAAVTVVVAYHIARAQGYFRKSKLMARFGVTAGPEVGLIIYSLPANLKRDAIVVALFFLKNESRRPLSNIGIQLNLYPRRELADLSAELRKTYEDPRGVRMYSMEDRDVLEFRVTSLAPEEAQVIAVPYLIKLNEADGKVLGHVSVHLTHDQGRKLQKTVHICGIKGLTIGDESGVEKALSPILDAISHSSPIRLSRNQIAINAVLRLPIARLFWLLYGTEVVSAGKNLAFDKILFDRREPKMRTGAYEIHSTGKAVVSSVLFVFGPLVLCILLLVAVKLVELRAGHPLMH